MVKIAQEPKDNTISVLDMKDGDIAIIVDWSSRDHLGKIVQRYKDNLITVGKHSGEGWSSFFLTTDESPKRRVRILPKGTLLEID